MVLHLRRLQLVSTDMGERRRWIVGQRRGWSCGKQLYKSPVMNHRFAKVPADAIPSRHTDLPKVMGTILHLHVHV